MSIQAGAGKRFREAVIVASDRPLTVREPLPRGFWAYVSLLGGIGAAGVAGPFYVKESVLSVVSRDVTVLQTQMATVNETLRRIDGKLEAASDWHAEQLRVDSRIRTLVKDSALKQ